MASAAQVETACGYGARLSAQYAHGVSYGLLAHMPCLTCGLLMHACFSSLCYLCILQFKTRRGAILLLLNGSLQFKTRMGAILLLLSGSLIHPEAQALMTAVKHARATRMTIPPKTKVGGGFTVGYVCIQPLS